MSAPTRPEVWLRGPLPGIDAVPMPAAHTSRHPGQIITTLKIAGGLRAAPAP